MSAACVCASGCGAFCGGIMPTRILRIAFSQTSAVADWSAMLALSSISPAVLVRSLWQPTQYLVTTARSRPSALGGGRNRQHTNDGHG